MNTGRRPYRNLYQRKILTKKNLILIVILFIIIMFLFSQNKKSTPNKKVKQTKITHTIKNKPNLKNIAEPTFNYTTRIPLPEPEEQTQEEITTASINENNNKN